MSNDIVDVSYQAFDVCRGRVREAVQAFDMAAIMKESGSVDPGTATSPAMFGKLARAEELAAKMTAVWAGIGAEIGNGSEKLNHVEQALAEVKTNLVAAEKASGA